MWQISTRRAELKIQKSVYNPGQITAKKSLNYADVRSRGPCTTTTNGTKGRKKREKRDFPFFIPIFLCVHLACTSLVNILKQREDWRRLKGGRRAVSLGETFQPHSYHLNIIIAELAERSSIIIKNSSNPSSRKILDVRPYDRTTVRPYMVLLLTCVVDCTAGTPIPRLCPVVQWSVHQAPSRTTRVLVLAGARHCALETRRKKNASSAFRLG